MKCHGRTLADPGRNQDLPGTQACTMVCAEVLLRGVLACRGKRQEIEQERTKVWKKETIKRRAVEQDGDINPSSLMMAFQPDRRTEWVYCGM